MRVRPVTVPRLVGELADRIAATARGRWLRVAVDGAEAADPDTLAGALVDPLRVRGRPVVTVRAADFLRPASLRLELGRSNPDSFYERWFDEPALAREVLARVADGGSGRILPTLWDPQRDRATRVDYLTVPPGAAVLVSGPFLLGGALRFDFAVHLALRPDSLRRRTPAQRRWTLPAYERYGAEVGPEVVADVVVRCDDPQRPAVVEQR